MADSPGHDPGQGPGFDWGDYVAWIVETHGTLAAGAEKLAAHRAYEDDVASVERALRRLRGRGALGGGTWGGRALAAFGLPGAARERARWMGAYHSRFTDLPVPLCVDLVRLWDRPPIAEDPSTRVWLALAHATCALRNASTEEATAHLRSARASFAIAPPDARAELLLVEAFVASRDDVEGVPAILDEVEPILSHSEMTEADRACLRVRLVDQRAYELNRRKGYEAGEALYRTIADANAPPFVLCRRANGLAYARWKLGHTDEAAALARDSARHAGDGGHLRLRGMALSMLGRILEGTEEGAAAKARALAIVASLDDEALRLRFTRGDG